MFIANARKGNNTWYLYVAMVAFIFLGYSIGQIPLMAKIYMTLDSDPTLGTDDLNRILGDLDFGLLGINTNVGFLLLLLMFVAAFLILFFFFPLIHKRPFKTLITWKESINWSKVFFGFGIWLALGLALEAIFYVLHSETYTFRFSASQFFPLLLISLLILPIQTSMEELFFRGYLLQGIGLLVKNRWIPLIITSILFGLIHSSNPEIEKFGFWTMQVYYLSAGLLLGVVTLMDDSLELALGVHAATNFIGAVIVGYDGAALQTDSLFKTETMNATWMTQGFIIAAIIFILICKKKYNWGSFNRLLLPIDQVA